MTLTINEIFILGKSKEWVGCSMYLMTVLVENDNWEEIVRSCHAHGGTKFSTGSCIPSKYMNQGKPSGSFLHKKSLPYRLNHFSLIIHSGSHGLEPWVTKIIPSFVGFLMAFLLEIWTYTLAFSYVSQGPFLKDSKGHIKVQGPWCSSCCISSGLTEILAACPLTWPSLGPLLPFIIIIISFFFILFRTLGLHGPS